jgi:hypothetical protein
MRVGFKPVELSDAIDLFQVIIKQIEGPVWSITESFAVLNGTVKDSRHSAPLFKNRFSTLQHVAAKHPFSCRPAAALRLHCDRKGKPGIKANTSMIVHSL